jgi:hypothetical protein
MAEGSRSPFGGNLLVFAASRAAGADPEASRRQRRHSARAGLPGGINLAAGRCLSRRSGGWAVVAARKSRGSVRVSRSEMDGAALVVLAAASAAR